MFMHRGGLDLVTWLFMVTGTVLFLIIIVAAIVVVIRAPRYDHTPSPERILADRHARGEITDDEYRRCSDLLDRRS